MFDIGMPLSIRVGAIADVLIGALERMINGAVSAIGVTADADAITWLTKLTALGFVTLSESL